MTKYYNAWPCIEIPEFLQRQGWQDISWGNDTCASSFLSLVRKPGDRTQGMEPGIRVWVEHSNPEEREYPDEDRFLIEWIANDDQWSNGEARILYRGEDEWEAAEVILGFLAGFAAESILDDLRVYRGRPAGILTCRTFAQLHDYCDANMLGIAPGLADLLGLDFAVDVLNVAQEEVTRMLQKGELIKS